MRIATWNVNSLRSRIDRVEAFLAAARHRRARPARRPRPREDQLPLMGLQAAGYEVAAAGYQPVERRRDDQPRRARRREVGFDGMPGYGEPAGGRGAGDRRDLRRRTHLVALRAQRPQARRPALRLQARLAGPAPRGRRRAGWTADRPGRRLEHLPRPTTTSSTRPHSRTPARHRRRSARPSRPSSTTGRPTSPGRTRRPGVYTYWDYYRQRFERNRGIAIDFLLGTPAAGGAGHRRRSSTARNAPGRAPPTTHPSSSIWTSPCPA